jgi:hypothetical protein
MTGDAVLEIARLERDKKHFFQVPSEPSDVFYLVEGESTLRYVAEHPIPQITCYSTQALLEMASEEAKRECRVELYYSAAKVQVLAMETMESDERRNRYHTLNLPLHPVFKLLEGLTRTRAYGQRDLIRFLRAELNAYTDESVVEQFRHLNLNSSGEGSSVVDKGRAGVSRSVMQTIKAKESDIPDQITVKVPVYDIHEMLEETFEVGVLVDCLPDDEGRPVFELTTIHSDLQAAKHSALEVIAERLKQGTFPVIYGQAS